MWTMLQAFLSGLASTLESMWVGITSFFGWIRDHLGFLVVALLGPIAYLAGNVYEYITKGEELRSLVESSLGGWSDATTGVSGLAWCDRLNYVAPLEELVGAVGVCMVIVVSLGIFKFVRSLIW